MCCRPNQIAPLNVVVTSTTKTTTPTTTVYDPPDRLIFDSEPPSSTTADVATNETNPTAATEFDPGLLLELSALLLNHSISGLPEPLESLDGNGIQVGTSDSPGLDAEPTVCGVRHRQAKSSRVFFQDDGDVADDAAAELIDPVQGMANFGEFPWTAALYKLVRNGSFVYHCAAALLDDRTLITAAHCVSK